MALSRKPMLQIFERSEAEIGQVAIAGRSAGAGHERAINRGHQACEQPVGRGEAEQSNLEHCYPLLWCAVMRLCFDPGANLGIPDASGNPFVCIAATSLLHCSMGPRSVPNPKGRRIGATQESDKNQGFMLIPTRLCPGKP